nr:hypothetical protein [Tanacetum cinerariifolium]
MQDEQVGVLSDRVTAIDSDLMEMVLYMDDEFYPRYLATIAERRKSITDVVAFNPSTESDYIAAINALQGVSSSLLAQLEANKNASMADIMDLLRLEFSTVETSKGRQLDVAARCLSFMDYILPLVEPLSARNLIGEASSPTDFTTAAITAFSTTFAQTHLVPAALSTKVPPSPKVVFKEEKLDTMLEHVLAL